MAQTTWEREEGPARLQPGRAGRYLPFLPLAGRCDSAEPAAILAGLDVDDWSVLLAAVAARALVTFDEFDDLAMAHLTQVQVRQKVAAIGDRNKMS